MGIFDMMTDAVVDTAKRANDMATSYNPETRQFENADIAAILERRSEERPGEFNWQSSIVDLMKLLDLDASYENRKQLAQELGRADYSGTAEDNIWLHREVMNRFAARGGTVPDSLKTG